MIAAGLALVGIAVGLHHVGSLAIVLWSVGSLMLFASAFLGGLAIRRVSARGSGGDWRLVASAYHFSFQAGAFVIGTLVFVGGSIAAFSSDPRPSRDAEQDRAIRQLSIDVDELRMQSKATQRALNRRKAAR